MASLDGSLTVARARRRPARYSPELSASAQQQQLQQQQQPQQQSEMCIGELHASTPEAAAAALVQQLQEQEEELQLQQQQRELLQQQHQQQQQQQQQQQEEENEEVNDGEMAPAAKRTKHKPKRRYKKRQGVEDASTKRPRVANVLLENEMLIDEIRERKALWMRTHEQHHSSVLTAPLWEEIAKVLDTTQDSIRRRWKSLKDHYRRELKKSMTDATAPPSTWPYYKKMRFMKSQMFVSLRRKNGEDHLEILSDDEEDINGQWHGQEARKQEGGSDTMDDYELSEDYNEMVKYEQMQLQQLAHGQLDGTQEEEDDEEDEQQQQQQQQQEEQEEQLQEQEELSPIPSLPDQELSALQQQQADLTDMSDMSTIQQQPVITADISTMTTIADMVGIPTIVTTTASSLVSGRLSALQQRAELSGRLPALQQRASDMQHSGRLSAMQQNRDLDGELADLSARHTAALQQQRAEINGRISAMQRNAEMSAIQQRANINALHERAEITAMQQRAEMQQRNGVVDNGVDNPNGVSPMIGDDRGGISDDYHFFMSLMPHVKHFTSLQKLKVRNRIQQIIIEEASNCQYDPLANC